MTPPDETLAWTESQIEFEIARHIPEGAEFVCEWQADAWSARVERPSTEGAEVLHAALHLDRRMALYEVYGLLWLGLQPQPRQLTAWDPTVARPSVASVSQFIQSKFSDPEDVDPGEVAAVYGIPSSQHGRN